MAIPSAEEINARLVGFDRLVGLELLSCSDEEVLVELPVREQLKQPMGLVHGGVYAALAETMASLATALAVSERGEAAVGLANATNFLRPITEGTIHASATRVHRGRTTWVWDVRFEDDDGRACAVTRMTIAVRAARRQGA
jgi:uncharacterized protein (TIGR00369 family)